MSNTMTKRGHYQMAETLLRKLDSSKMSQWAASFIVAQAQVHATLATVDPGVDEGA